MEQHYVTINEVAEYFNVSVSTVRGWIRSGAVPKSAFLKLGNTYRFRLPEIETALRSETLQPEVKVVATTDPKQLELDFNPDEDI